MCVDESQFATVFTSLQLYGVIADVACGWLFILRGLWLGVVSTASHSDVLFDVIAL